MAFPVTIYQNPLYDFIQRINTKATAYTAMCSICSIGIVAFIAATVIVISLIPLYLPNRQITLPVKCNPPCMNGGNCTSQAFCVCPIGVYGEYCQYQTPGGLCSASLDSTTTVLLTTFGAGSAQVSSQTPADFGFTTSYTQIFDKPKPESGQFTFVNSLPLDAAWHGGATDHTGDSGGYMFLINAGLTPGQFYYRIIKNLCVGVRYEFSVYGANVVVAGWNLALPNILFQIRTATPDNTLLAEKSSGDMQEMGSLTWVQYGMSFVATSSSVVLLMISNTPYEAGNDLVLDDIRLRTCYSGSVGICRSG